MAQLAMKNSLLERANDYVLCYLSWRYELRMALWMWRGSVVSSNEGREWSCRVLDFSLRSRHTIGIEGKLIGRRKWFCLVLLFLELWIKYGNVDIVWQCFFESGSRVKLQSFGLQFKVSAHNWHWGKAYWKEKMILSCSVFLGAMD